MLTSKADLPPIPSKRYFTVTEVSELTGVKPYVLRLWEQEFAPLRSDKKTGKRRYYQHHEVLMIRRIRELLFDDGFTFQGARQRLQAGEVVVPPITAQEVRAELESLLVWLDSGLGKSE